MLYCIHCYITNAAKENNFRKMETQQIKRIMNVSDLLPIINLPWDENQQVEVHILPLHQKKNKITPQSMKGILSEYANPDLIPLEKEAWVMHCEEKYGNP